ncbi:MAG: YggT family protein [Treponema sp.]|nr:YggT family protein [Treponema sp.]
MSHLFAVLSTVIGIYSLLCFIRIILTWVPSLSYSGFARFLAQICDPYLNLFRGIRWLRLGNFDLSPALALCALGAVTTVLGNIANRGKLSLAVLLAMAIGLVWNIIHSLLFFLVILMAIRLILLFLNKDFSNSPIFEVLDNSISPLAFRITSTFTHGRSVTYKTALITALVVLLVAILVGNIVIGQFCILLGNLPF